MKEKLTHVKDYGLVIRGFKAPLNAIYGYDAKSAFICTKFPSPKYQGRTVTLLRWVYDSVSGGCRWIEFEEKYPKIIDYIRTHTLVVGTHTKPGVLNRHLRQVTPKDRRVNYNFDGRRLFAQNQIDPNPKGADNFVTRNDLRYWVEFKK